MWNIQTLKGKTSPRITMSFSLRESVSVVMTKFTNVSTTSTEHLWYPLCPPLVDSKTLRGDMIYISYIMQFRSSNQHNRSRHEVLERRICKWQNLLETGGFIRLLFFIFVFIYFFYWGQKSTIFSIIFYLKHILLAIWRSILLTVELYYTRGRNLIIVYFFLSTIRLKMLCGFLYDSSYIDFQDTSSGTLSCIYALEIHFPLTPWIILNLRSNSIEYVMYSGIRIFEV